MKSNHPYKEFVDKNGYKLINCDGCGYWHVHPMLTTEELNSYYEKKYYETLGDNRGMTEKLDDPDGFYKIQYEDRLRHITRNLCEDLPRSILDIGAGYGDFLSFMKSAGWETHGIEPSQHACKLIKEIDALNIKCAAIGELTNLGFKKVSVVTLNNVLEHLNDPRKILEITKEHLLLPGGLIFIILPNDFSFLQNMLMKTVLKDNDDKKHYWLCPPEHLNYWSHKTIKCFLKRCGFKPLSFTADFPLEFFPLMGEDYITSPELGRKAHLKRVSFEKYFHETHSEEFKDSLYSSFAQLGIGRAMHIIAKVS